MRTLIPVLAALVLVNPVSSDQTSGPGRVTLAEEPWGTIYCAQGCRINQDATGARWLLETSRGPVSVQRRLNGWLIQAANQNLRVDEESQGAWRFHFNASKYRLEKSPNRVLWSDPASQTLQYNLEEGGRSLECEGFQGRISIVENEAGDTFQIDSTAGQTRVTIKNQQVEARGISLSQHPYLLPGVLLDNEVVGVYIKLPGARALAGLGWEQAPKIASQVPFAVRIPAQPRRPDPLNLAPKPFETAPTLEETLQQKPANDWTFPSGVQQVPKEPLQSIQAPKGVDPFKPVSAPKGSDPLRAQEAPKGQDPLNLNRKPFSRDKTLFEIQRDSKGAIPPP
jgi:hypothetical protein